MVWELYLNEKEKTMASANEKNEAKQREKEDILKRSSLRSGSHKYT